MPRTARRSAQALLATVVLAASCKSTSTGPADTTLDVANVLSELNSTANVSSGAIATGAVPSSAAVPGGVIPGPCAYTAASQNFVCPPITANGITYTRTYWLSDASGTFLSTPDAKRINAVRTLTTAKGTYTMPSVIGMVGTPGAAGTATAVSPPVMAGTSTIDRSDDMTMGGLLGPQRTMNGVSSLTNDLTLGTGTSAQKTHIVQSTVTANVLFPPIGKTAQIPIGGSITNDEVVTVAATTPLSMHSVLTFHADGSSTMVVTYNGVTKTCTTGPISISGGVTTTSGNSTSGSTSGSTGSAGGTVNSGTATVCR